MEKLALKYINIGKEFLKNEYGTFEGRTTGIEIDEYLEEYERVNLQNETLKNDKINNSWWDNEYTIFIEFK